MGEVLTSKGAGIIHAESLAMGASAETLATAGATIPQNTGTIIVVTPSGDSLHWLGKGTPTSTLGHRITHGSPGIIPHDVQKTAEFISDDAGDVTCILIYLRGSGRADVAYSLSEPF
jgi:hypothetical protein